MYYLLSLLTGILISSMVTFNGRLTGHYGIYLATVIIHIAGFILISALVLAKRANPFSLKNGEKFASVWFLYLGGAIGVLTTVFNNLAFGRISVSALLALGLFGQSLTGIMIDQYGFLGMPKHPFNKRKIIGLLLIIGGIASMVNNFEIVAVTVSFAAGVCIVLSRTLNAKLADLTSVRTSTFFNYLVGLAVSAVVLFVLGRSEIASIGTVVPTDIFVFFGGLLGVCVVLLNTILVVRISAFYLTLLIFVGQVFSGVLIDVILSQQFSPRILVGGILVAMGLCVNLLLDRKADKH